MSQKVSKKGNLLLELRNNINMVIKKIFVNIYIIYRRLRDRVQAILITLAVLRCQQHKK